MRNKGNNNLTANSRTTDLYSSTPILHKISYDSYLGNSPVLFIILSSFYRSDIPPELDFHFHSVFLLRSLIIFLYTIHPKSIILPRHSSLCEKREVVTRRDPNPHDFRICTAVLSWTLVTTQIKGEVLQSSV